MTPAEALAQLIETSVDGRGDTVRSTIQALARVSTSPEREAERAELRMLLDVASAYDGPIFESPVWPEVVRVVRRLVLT